MDGTLVDSEKVWDVALNELAERAGGKLSLPARHAMIGSNMGRSMQILRDDLGQPDRPEAPDVQWLTDRVFELFGEGLVWRPGALELLRAVRAAGLPTALVTSTGRRLVEVALRTIGAENFDAVVVGDEVKAPKPDPEPYLTAARLLGVPITSAWRSRTRRPGWPARWPPGRRYWRCRPSWSCRRPTACTCATPWSASTWPPRRPPGPRRPLTTGRATTGVGPPVAAGSDAAIVTPALIRRQSCAMAPSTLSRAARIAGSTAAMTPTRPASSR